jgi:lipopolysaccharide transport system ATP-binding protein
MDTVIKVDNISKLYQLGQIGTGTLSRDLNRWWASVRGKEDPFQKLGEVNNRSVKGNSQFVWSLKDINFEVKQGEVLGIIGKNGAGKSTLLKILSQITAPTTGSVKAKGRIASLLEVGTGFHPDLTGRENIFLNGAILGMRKAEIKRKFDEIVEFAGVAKYVDTPVKRYSSGMTVRLGFAVAAYLEAEILVVDEVLAVGDAEFQNKAVGKMHDISADGGRTVLFVSHNMSSVKSLCTRGMLLKHGMIDHVGDVSETIDKYLTGDSDMADTGIIPVDLQRQYWTGEARYRRVVLKDINDNKKNEFYYRSPFIVELELEVMKEIQDAIVTIMIGTLDGLRIVYQDSSKEHPQGIKMKPGKYNVTTVMNEHLLPGSYSIYLGLVHTDRKTIEWLERAYDFHVLRTSVNADEHYRWRNLWGYVLNDKPIEIKPL